MQNQQRRDEMKNSEIRNSRQPIDSQPQQEFLQMYRQKYVQSHQFIQHEQHNIQRDHYPTHPMNDKPPIPPRGAPPPIPARSPSSENAIPIKRIGNFCFHNIRCTITILK